MRAVARLPPNRMAVSIYAVALLAATALGASISPSQVESSACGRVWVTVHSPTIRVTGASDLLDAIELNWDFNACSNVPTQIGLFDDRPLSWVSALAVYPVSSIEGHVVTNFSLGDVSLPAGWESGTGIRGPHCLWPWAGAGDSQILAHNCLKIQPTWMEDNAEKINRLRVGELAIPGTHNAGAWRFDTEISSVTRDSFVLCQDRSVWAQLVHGIRYFDFRIGYYDFYAKEEDRYWLNHNLIRVRPLVPLLREIRVFLDSTKEVVFLDAHHFPIGFYEQNGAPIRHVHEGLIRIVQNELGPHLALATQFSTGSGTRGPTVQSLVDADKRLLFSYVDNNIVLASQVESSACGRVWVTVHSPTIRVTGASDLLDAIELNWDFNACSNVPTQIGLFDDRPLSWVSALAVYPVSSIEGHVVTNFSLGDVSLPAGWESGTGIRGPHCLWPWAGAGDSQILAHNCLKIQPTWMEDNADKINRLRVGELAIPGTHNAGAWRFDTEISSVSRDSFVLCQDRSVWAQLVHGIRYFDFRIGYYDFYAKEEDRYWLNHNLIRVRPLVPLLREIRVFLDSTKEVVFLDAHHFPIGFYEQNGAPIRHVHEGLIRIVQNELGPHMALATQFSTGSGTRGPTVQSLVDADKRLLFSYVDNNIVLENSWLWPILPHLWANTNNPTELFAFLDRTIGTYPQPSARSPLYSAMAQTTPTVIDILFLRGSVRDNADDVNRNVTARLTGKWRNQANIVSTDFFLGNDVIDVSISISLERAGRL